MTPISNVNAYTLRVKIEFEQRHLRKHEQSC